MGPGWVKALHMGHQEILRGQKTLYYPLKVFSPKSCRNGPFGLHGRKIYAWKTDLNHYAACLFG